MDGCSESGQQGGRSNKVCEEAISGVARGGSRNQDNDKGGGGKKLTAAAALGSSEGSDRLTPAQLEPLLVEAIQWFAMAGVDTSDLGHGTIRIADLGGSTLGLVTGNTIWLDDDAAGWGWFVDTTYREDREFVLAGDQGSRGTWTC